MRPAWRQIASPGVRQLKKNDGWPERYIENGSFAHVLHGLSSETDWPGREDTALGPGFGVRAAYGPPVR